MTTSRLLPLFAGLALLAAACSKNDVDPPAELTDFRATAKVERVWSSSTRGAEPKLRLGLGVALDGETLYAAGHGGDVVAMNRDDGRRVWRTDTRLKLSGGPGVGEGLVVVGATHGGIVALDAQTGAVRWKTQVNSEILSAPAIANRVVLFRAVDGRVFALRAADGELLWSAEQQVPRLSLRGTSQPVIADNLAVSGFDNGRLMALTLDTGNEVWNVAVAPPSGRTEIDRLVDLDANVQSMDDDIYAVNFHGKAVRLQRDNGSVQWEREISSYAGFALDEDGFYVATDDGALVKLGRRTGVEMWRQDVLTRRRLSQPAVLGSLVAVADLDGYVHFFDKDSGELAARIRPLDGRVLTAPLVSNGLLILMDAEGKIAALRVARESGKG